MFQVVQEIKQGKTSVEDLPAPLAAPENVVVATVCSVVSAGTERYVVDLAKKNLLQKAKERPDHVRRVLQKLKQEGLVTTLQQVQAKLDEPMPLGYSASGIVIECGRGVSEFKPGDRVAMAAPHAEVVGVGKNLCARIPDGVTFEQAAYTSIASIALEGVRLANVELGARVLVIGLGLIGQICCALLKAQGCRVFGTDIDPDKLKRATAFGVDRVALGSPVDDVRSFSNDYGVDAVVITAATQSNEPIEFAAEACRSKGRIVLVGVAGLNIPRQPFFKKELEFTVSSSLGAGRGDARYEERGVDYPIGYARWTVQRNMQTALELMANGQLPVDALTTHHFPIERAAEAYDLITSGNEPYYGIVIRYSESPRVITRRIDLAAKPHLEGEIGVSVVGVGNFARLVMMPILSKMAGVTWRGICSAKGMNAVHSGRAMGFNYATSDVEEIIGDPKTRAVLIFTRHDLHADLIIKALRAGKAVFVEKPLCITGTELEKIRECVAELGSACPVLTVGFNRRFSTATTTLRDFFADVVPLNIMFRFATGALPSDAWPHDASIGGGRIVGEACHAIDCCIALNRGDLPTRVYAESVECRNGVRTNEDRVFIALRFQNGSVANIAYIASGDRSGPKERIEIFGGGRTAVVDEWDKITLWRDNKKNPVRGWKDKGHASELQCFFSGLRDGRWPIPWRELYATTLASLKAVESLQSGLPMQLNL